MKGVVVEVRDGHSTVLFNNGKVGAIPTPSGCKEGTVITLNWNRNWCIIPIAAFLVLLAAGGILWFALHDRGVSPKQFCSQPFLQKSIVMPYDEYASYDALFSHLGQPRREFNTDYPKVKNNGDRVRGFNYQYYNMVTYYSEALNKVMVSAITINSKDILFTGNFSIGADRSAVEALFKAYMSSNKKGVLFSRKKDDMQFTTGSRILLFKFNGKNTLTGIEIRNSHGR
jgi:hypothetical protein